MHRHSLGRQAAWQQLQRLAAQQGVSADAQAERLLGAVEELARTAL
jgi:two-component system, response regulator PdtaR